MRIITPAKDGLVYTAWAWISGTQLESFYAQFEDDDSDADSANKVTTAVAAIAAIAMIAY